jgi:hypothetical protein
MQLTGECSEKYVSSRSATEIDPAVELMLFGVESHAKGPPVWKEETVNLKPTRVGRLRGTLMSIIRMQLTG